VSHYEQVLVDGCWQASADAVGGFRAEDPARGEPIGPLFPISGSGDVEAVLRAAKASAPSLAAVNAVQVAEALVRCAAAIEADADALVALAHAETGLPVQPRLREIELPRTCDQLRQAAEAALRRSWRQPVIDTRHGLRAWFGTLAKPVWVIGPNNFPFAFNASAGSDFASALVAGNPVIAKAHPGHPATSQRLAACVHRALVASGLPPASLQMLYHMEPSTGLRLAADPRLGAIGFTGSRRAGLALKAAADAAGVSFHGEMSSLNPVFLLPGALRERSEAIADELFASCTLGSGQFCTRPGLCMVPRGAQGDRFVEQVQTRFAAAAPAILLAFSVLQQLEAGIAGLRAAGARLLSGGQRGSPGYRYMPSLLEVDAGALAQSRALQSEVFGPITLLVRCEIDQMPALAAGLEGQLCAAIYRARDGVDNTQWSPLAAALRPRVGRLIDSRMPTGVAVSPAQQHGGPFPSSSHAGFSAVGMPGAIRRFAAWQCFDHVADALLPHELRDRNPDGIARLVNGEWTCADLEPQP
jgi:NADP-dependent aldehyde dehydrogenase